MKHTLAQYLKMDYSYMVYPDEYTDGTPCYMAENPDLPGCMSHGATPEEAINSLQEARRLYLKTLISNGVEPPLPHSPSVGTAPSPHVFYTMTTIVLPLVIVQKKTPSVDASVKKVHKPPSLMPAYA